MYINRVKPKIVCFGAGAHCAMTESCNKASPVNAYTICFMIKKKHFKSILFAIF